MMEPEDEEFTDSISDLTIANNNFKASQPKHYLKKGILLKKGRNKLYRPWALRTVILLNSSTLLYYDNNTLKGCISLEDTVITHLSKEDANNKPYAFIIDNIKNIKSNQVNSLILVASSEYEANDWVNTLTNIVKSLQRSKERVVSGTYVSLQQASAGNDNLSLDIKRIKEDRQRAYAEKQMALINEEDNDNLVVDNSELDSDTAANKYDKEDSVTISNPIEETITTDSATETNQDLPPVPSAESVAISTTENPPPPEDSNP